MNLHLYLYSARWFRGQWAPRSLYKMHYCTWLIGQRRKIKPGQEISFKSFRKLCWRILQFKRDELSANRNSKFWCEYFRWDNCAVSEHTFTNEKTNNFQVFFKLNLLKFTEGTRWIFCFWIRPIITSINY